jgi:hypothetical protein
MSVLCSKTPPAGCAPATSTTRIADCFARRYNTSVAQAGVTATHTSNGDEAAYADKCATYTKCIKQDSPGKVNLAAFTAFRTAIDTASYAAFEAIPAGGPRTLNGPVGSFAYTYFGADSSQFGDSIVDPAPRLASKQYATELIELYWCSLLRDVAFTRYHSNPVAQQAAAELSTAIDYKGPKDSGQVTPALLFRGDFPGEKIGPHISQLLLLPCTFGALAIEQRYLTYRAGVDYMTDLVTWADVQNGIPTGVVDQPDPVHRYLHNGRGLAAYTHVDELFEAYFIAYLVLGYLKVSPNPGNPYVGAKRQNGFGTFGGPDIAATLSQVAKVALNAVWYQKWPVHLRHRPESGAGMVHLINTGTAFSGSPDSSVFASQAAAACKQKYGTWLLSQPFPEGSPAHPAYPTGHGAVGGACITILKFFFDGNYTFSNPQVPSSSGTSLETWDYDPKTGDPGVLTLNSELHKLAHNISFGHGLHGGIHWRSDTDSSMLLGEAVAISFLQDLACTYAEKFTITFTKLDGTPQTISN